MKDQESDLADLLRGDSALLDAAKKGNLDRVKKLLTSENIDCRDKQGRNSTPLHLAGLNSVPHNKIEGRMIGSFYHHHLTYIFTSSWV